MSISNKAILVNVKISQWVGRKLDKRATETVAISHSTDGKVGNYTKKLLPGAEELAEITRLAQSIRNFFYEQTLPWCADGSRILASKNYLEFTKAFNLKKDAFDQAVQAFIYEYPRLQAIAYHKLGDLYKEAEYPSIDKLRQSYRCEINFFPIPEVSDFRVQISEEEKLAFQKHMQEVEANATQECWKRLYDTVSKAANKLNAPDAIFRDSLIENITECCTLLSKLNITDDPTLESMRMEIEKLASKINPDTCRESEIARNETAKQLNDITSRMSAFMGAQ